MKLVSGTTQTLLAPECLLCWRVIVFVIRKFNSNNILQKIFYIKLFIFTFFIFYNCAKKRHCSHYKYGEQYYIGQFVIFFLIDFYSVTALILAIICLTIFFLKKTSNEKIV